MKRNYIFHRWNVIMFQLEKYRFFSFFFFDGFPKCFKIHNLSPINSGLSFFIM